MVFCLINGTLLSDQEAFVSIADRGFRYGDGVFETIAVVGGVPYQFDWHMARMAAGLASIRIPYDSSGLQAECRGLLHANNIETGLLRIQITRGSGGRGYLPGVCSPNVIIETMPAVQMPAEPGKLHISEYRKISARALPVRYKLCQGLNSTLARMKAADHHCFDALLLNERGELCETSSGNIFWLKNGILYTPSLECGVLEGSTRAAIMRLSPYPVQEEVAPIEALKTAESVVITNAAWPVIAVNDIPGVGMFQSDALAVHLKDIIAADRSASAAQFYSAWSR